MPLSVHQVLRLHKGLEDVSRHPVDRAMCAYALVTLYGRARHSDLEQISSITHDHDKHGGFLEILTRKHKGAKSGQKKSKFMPILVPAIGVHGKPWMHFLVDVFQGLRLPVDGAIAGPVLPAPRDCRGEEFSCRAIESGEVTAFLRTLLSLPAPVAGERSVSSHSLKATCLSSTVCQVARRRCWADIASAPPLLMPCTQGTWVSVQCASCRESMKP